MGGSWSSPEAQPTPRSRFAAFVDRASFSPTTVTVASFEAALPAKFRPWANDIFQALCVQAKPCESECTSLRPSELELVLRELEKNGSKGLVLPGTSGLNAVLSHNVTMALSDSGDHLFPSLPRKLADALLSALLEEKPASAITLNSTMVRPWHMELLTLAFLPHLSTECVEPHLLYSIRQHGLSLKTLLQNAHEYGERAIVFLANSQDGQSVFGFFSPNGLKTSTLTEKRTATNYGLFQLEPELRIRRWTGWEETGRNFLHADLAGGIGLGGHADLPRMKISADLRRVTCMPSDATYEAGPVVGQSQDDVIVGDVEVWSLGTCAEWAAYERNKRDLKEVKEERKKVDRQRMLVESEFDREMFFSKTFSQTSSPSANTQR